jgi:hypothetical protein
MQPLRIHLLSDRLYSLPTKLSSRDETRREELGDATTQQDATTLHLPLPNNDSAYIV